jgi:hypothetical protein
LLIFSLVIYFKCKKAYEIPALEELKNETEMHSVPYSRVR